MNLNNNQNRTQGAVPTPHSVPPTETQDSHPFPDTEVPMENKSVEEVFLEYCRCINTSSVNLNNALVFKTSSLPSSTCSSIVISEGEVTNFGMNVLYPLSSKLLHEGKYHEQSLVVLVFSEKITFTSLTKSEIDCKKMKSVIIFERSDDFQAYRLSNLSICPHFTLLTSDLPLLISGLHQCIDDPIEVTFIANTVAFYSHPSMEAMIMNSCYDTELSLQVTKSSTAMFEAGLGDHFSLQDQGRGDVIGDIPLKAENPDGSIVPVLVTRKERIIPTFTFGYSNMDCHRYKSNRFTVLGNTKPFISDGGMNGHCKSAYLNYIKTCMTSLIAKDAFNLDCLNTDEKAVRSILMDDVYSNLGGDINKEHSWFANESNSDSCVDRLAAHCDKQNSAVKGLDTVLVFSAHPPVECLLKKKEKSPVCDSKLGLESKSKPKFSLHDYVVSKGYTSRFPHTRVHYMKNIVDSYVKKQIGLEKLSKKDDLRSLVVWGLTETINTPLDYRGYVFDNDSFPELWENDAESLEKEGSIIKGRHLKLVPSFDKLGYYSIILEVWNLLVIDIFTSVTIINAIEYAFYCALTCNGTALTWRISTEVSKDPKKAQLLFKSVGSMFLFLKNMDTKIASYQKEEKESEDRKPGYCTLNRFAPSILAMSTDWNNESLGLLFVINVAFYGGDADLLPDEWKETAKK